jgi:hypothetical protein
MPRRLVYHLPYPSPSVSNDASSCCPLALSETVKRVATEQLTVSTFAHTLKLFAAPTPPSERTFAFRRQQAPAAPPAQPGMNKSRYRPQIGPDDAPNHELYVSARAVERSVLSVTNCRGGHLRGRASGEAVLAAVNAARVQLGSVSKEV